MERFDRLAVRLGEIDGLDVVRDLPLAQYTTFRIGGPAAIALFPHTAAAAQTALDVIGDENMPYAVIGNGSNLLCADAGFSGAVLFTGKMKQMTFSAHTVTADCGVSLTALAVEAQRRGLDGLAFSYGIPGSLGGALRMNAGAYGGEMKDVLRKVTVLSGDGEIFDISKEEMELGYRTSIISKKGYITLEAEIELTPGKQEEIKAVMDDLRTRRTTKQPLEYPSAGSTFKRPEGYFAGKLIQDSGLAGYQVGGAQVSEKHCGFVINKEHATAADIDSLMKQVSAIVKDKFGVTLEPEVKKLGEF